jgi:hypothetical protein
MPPPGSPSRLFLACAPQDTKYAELIASKARQDRLPIEFDSLAEGRSDEIVWQNECRRRINRARAVVVVLSPRTRESVRAMWQVNYAREAGRPVAGITVSFDDDRDRSQAGVLESSSIVGWKWKIISAVLQHLVAGPSPGRESDDRGIAASDHPGGGQPPTASESSAA